MSMMKHNTLQSDQEEGCIVSKLSSTEYYNPEGTPVTLEQFVKFVQSRYSEWDEEGYKLSFWGSEGLKNIIENPRFELDWFTTLMIFIMKGEKDRLVHNVQEDAYTHIIVGGELEGNERNRFIPFDDQTMRLVVRHFLWNWIKKRGKYKKLKPAMWSYLQISAEELDEELKN